MAERPWGVIRRQETTLQEVTQDHHQNIESENDENEMHKKPSLNAKGELYAADFRVLLEIMLIRLCQNTGLCARSVTSYQ